MPQKKSSSPKRVWHSQDATCRDGDNPNRKVKSSTWNTAVNQPSCSFHRHDIAHDAAGYAVVTKGKSTRHLSIRSDSACPSSATAADYLHVMSSQSPWHPESSDTRVRRSLCIQAETPRVKNLRAFLDNADFPLPPPPPPPPFALENSGVAGLKVSSVKMLDSRLLDSCQSSATGSDEAYSVLGYRQAVQRACTGLRGSAYAHVLLRTPQKPTDNISGTSAKPDDVDVYDVAYMTPPVRCIDNDYDHAEPATLRGSCCPYPDHLDVRSESHV